MDIYLAALKYHTSYRGQHADPGNPDCPHCHIYAYLWTRRNLAWLGQEKAAVGRI